MSLSEIEIKEDEVYAPVSSKKMISVGKKYSSFSISIGIKGKQYSAYFGVIILDENDNEISRYVQWLNNFSSVEDKVEITFVAPNRSKYAIFIYRINIETPVKSHCIYRLLPIESISIYEEKYDKEDKYDVPENYVLPRLRELSSDEEDTFEQNLIWVFGSARSGTTWLAGQLMSYQTLYINEPLLGRHLGQFKKYRSFKNRDIDFYKRDLNYFFNNRYKETWLFYLRKLILNRFFAQFDEISKKLIIKEPNGSHASDIISECLPCSKIIILIRDCRDIVDSMFDARQEGSELTKTFQSRPIPSTERFKAIQIMSQDTVELIDILIRTYKSHKENLKLLVKYEDLLNDTTNELKKIYDFIGIDITIPKIKELVNEFSFDNIPQELKGKGKFYRFASPGKWKENFNEEEKKMMNDIMRDTLRKLGYQI